jgi:hypothetical protein
MSWSVCLTFDIQWPSSSGKNWGVITGLWTHHQTWRTSVLDPASFFTDVAELVMCSIWKYHHMASIFVFYALKFLWWITELSSIKKSCISYIALSWLLSFSGEWWSEREWSRLCASSILKLQSYPEVMRNQSDTCSNFIESTINLIWCQFDILHYLCLNLSWLKKNLN